MMRYEEHEKYNRIELYFDQKPPENIRSRLHKSGWWWSPVKKCWNNRNTDEAKKLARAIYEELERKNTSKISERLESKGTEMRKRYCYMGTVTDFLQTSCDTWLQEMKSNFSEAYLLSLGKLQIDAWIDCYHVLKSELTPFNEIYRAFHIVFEYALPYEAGRRPDVLLISNEYVLILEFKKKEKVLRADLDQVAAYCRDIQEYHYESRNKRVLPYLVVTKMQEIETISENGVHICSGDMLFKALCKAVPGKVTACKIETWLQSNYEPLPTIVEAARMIMEREELPHIRRVNSTGIPEAIKYLTTITNYAREQKKHILALVTGVPGSGKTFLGLQFVYDVGRGEDRASSVYLSGNASLVSVLTDALKSGVFVKNLHKIVEEYLKNEAKDFSNNVIVFDEGQRAWDKERMEKRYRASNASEPNILIRMAEERLEWCVLLILVGEGQEINSGENAGIGQWNDALKASSVEWEVLCPNKLATIFEGTQKVIDDASRNKLDLTVTLRTHLAGDVSNFVNNLIEGKIDRASEYVKKIKSAGFSMLVTRDLEKAKEYCKTRYAGQRTKRYGLIASSKKDSFMKKYGVDNGYAATSNVNIGKWFNTDARSGCSCCNLEKVVTEFGCQGLELDMPIVCWGPDMIWNGNSWNLYQKFQSADSDENIYRINSYWVLLTRGRDGFIIFVPNAHLLDGVYTLLIGLDMDEL